MNRLKFERLNRGLTQTMLSHMTQVAQPVICLIETGKWNPTPAELTAIARALAISPPELLLHEVTAVQSAESQPMPQVATR